MKWLFRTQQKADGSFPQNSDVDGTEEWTELQLDQVTLPIALAHLVGQTDERTYRGIKKAVRFLLTFRDEETGSGRRTRRRSAGRTSPATHPRPSPRRSTAWSPAPRSPAARATAGSPGSGSAPPTAGRRP